MLSTGQYQFPLFVLQRIRLCSRVKAHFPPTLPNIYDWEKQAKYTHRHTQTCTHTEMDSLVMNFAVGFEMWGRGG